jgi:hypothetical protein
VANVEDHDLDSLVGKRSQLHEQLAAVGDFRRGSVSTAYRRCGKQGCVCADPEHPGHGPLHLWTKSVAGKTVTKAVPTPRLEQTRREVGQYKRFQTLVQELVGVNEQICDARPLTDAVAQEAVGDGQKRGSKKRSKGRSPRK